MAFVSMWRGSRDAAVGAVSEEEATAAALAARDAGFYWVKFPRIDRLVVAEWFPQFKYWQVPGQSGVMHDRGVQGIICHERVKRQTAGVSALGVIARVLIALGFVGR